MQLIQYLNFSYIHKMLRNSSFTHIQDWYISSSLIGLNNLFLRYCFTIFTRMLLIFSYFSIYLQSTLFSSSI